MNIKKAIAAAIVFCALWPVAAALADDAMSLPAGYFRFRVKPMYIWNDEKWNENGDAEKIAKDYNTALNRDVFPELGELEDGLNDLATAAGLDPVAQGTLNFGRTEVEMNSVTWVMGTALEYGATDKVALGIIVPIIMMHNYASARVVGGNLGYNPPENADIPALTFLGGNADDLSPDKVPFLPTQSFYDLTEVSGIQTGIAQPQSPIGTEGVQQLLMQEYGYERFESWHSGWGLGDIELGFKHQVYSDDDWRVAYQAGVRAPTGEIDDPDNLVDYKFGDGQWDVGAYVMADWIPSKYFWLNVTNKYTLQFPDHITLRIPDDPDMPITPNKEHVARDMGDIYELEVESMFEVMPEFFVLRGKYNFRYKMPDKIDGNKGYNYDSLTDRSLEREHVAEVGFNFKTIEMFVNNQFPIPMEFGAYYMKSLAGVNTYKWQGIGAEVKFYFGPLYAFVEPPPAETPEEADQELEQVEPVAPEVEQ